MFFQTLLQSKSANAPIQFSGSDETNCFPVKGSEVNIVTSMGDHEVGSSKLKIKNIVNFGWEHKYYPGQLVSAHMSGTYIAYAITTPGKGCGVVRVVNRDTDDRILIKGMRGAVVDLSFAHTKEEVVIGAVDSLGNLFVHKVMEGSSGLASERVVEVVRDGEMGEMHRLIWCPYLPEPPAEEEDEEPDTSAARLLVLTHGPKAEVWSLDIVVEEHGPGPLAPGDVEHGLLHIQDIGGDVVDAAFSPDGSALATASVDGQVKFFQVYLHEEGPPRCLHQWSPHGGKPLSSLFFLDNHNDHQPEVQYWKYAVTACSLNTEIKVWSCESWTCLQTISFNRTGEDTEMRLKADLDPTARYLVLADIDKCLVYVLSLEQGVVGGAEVVSVAEFATPSAILTFHCVSGGKRMVKQSAEGVEVSMDDDVVENSDMKEKTVIRLYYVQPKSLQECSIIYTDAAVTPSLPPPVTGEDNSIVSLSPLANLITKSSPRDGCSPVGHSSPRYPDPPSLPLPPPAMTTQHQLAEAASKISLLSPDQFQPVPLPARQDTTSVKQESDTTPVLQVVQTVSGNSSPSREVANIMEEVGQYQDQEENIEEEEEESSPADRTFQDPDSTPSPSTSLKKFPTPPPIPQQVCTMPTDMDNVGLAIMRQIKQENDVTELDMAGLENRLEAAIMKRMDLIEERIAERATLERKEQVDTVVAALTGSITKKMERIVSKEIQNLLPSIVNRSMEGLERNMMSKMAGLETKMVKELTTSQSREAIGRSVGVAVKDMVETSYRQAFTQQSAGFERALQSLLQQMSEQFVAGSREYEAALARSMEVENTGGREMVAPLVSSMQGMNGEFRQMRDVMEKMKADQGSLSRKVGDIRPGVTGQEMREIVKQEVMEALARRSVSMTPQPEVKNITVQQNIQTLIQAGRLNDAFQTALSSNDLSLVVFTCELLNTTQVFNSSTCPLSQSVLLSLIQQLSVDLGEKTEVKHAYLHEALVNLDPENSTTKVHIRTVLGQLEQSLKMYIQANPNSKMTRNMKILAMAAGSHMQH